MPWPSKRHSGNQWWRAQPQLRSESSLIPYIHYLSPCPYNSLPCGMALEWLHASCTHLEISRSGKGPSYRCANVFSTYACPISMVAFSDRFSISLITETSLKQVGESEIVNGWLLGGLYPSSWDRWSDQTLAQVGSLHYSPLPVQVKFRTKKTNRTEPKDKHIFIFLQRKTTGGKAASLWNGFLVKDFTS